MTPHDEHLLYLRDRKAWAAYIAPRWKTMLERSDDTEKRRLWRIACPELRSAIAKLKKEIDK